jgi:hypothetical protein
MIRPKLRVLVVGSFLSLVTGCGATVASPGTTVATSAPTSSTTPPTTVTTTPPTTVTTTTRPEAPPFQYIGTVTESDGAGTVFTIRYSLGQLELGDSQSFDLDQFAGALNACSQNFEGASARSAYISGLVTFSYHGQLPASIGIDPTSDVLEYPDGGTPDDLVEDVDLNGNWVCVNTVGDEGGSSVTLSNGQSVTMPMVVLASQVLTNARPTLLPSEVPYWAFGGNVAVDGSDTLTNTVFSGPNAAVCSGPPVDEVTPQTSPNRIAMFAAPPYQLNTPDEGAPYSCEAP